MTTVERAIFVIIAFGIVADWLPRPATRRHKLIFAAAFVFTLLIAITAHAHPGRTDETGCHDVLKDWKSVDGKVKAKAGTRHCHPRTSDHSGAGALWFPGSGTFDTTTEVPERAKSPKPKKSP